MTDHFDILYYFGRFNFPHVGYLFVLESALKQLHPTQGITIIPSATSATWGKSALPYIHRHAMLNLALSDLPLHMQKQIHISPIENEQDLSGKTADTLEKIHTDSFICAGLLLGADAAIGLPPSYMGLSKWDRFDDICAHARPVIAPRGEYADASSIRTHLDPALLQKDPVILHAQPTKLQLEASSTGVQTGSHQYLPKHVLEYAIHHHLLVQ